MCFANDNQICLTGFARQQQLKIYSYCSHCSKNYGLLVEFRFYWDGLPCVLSVVEET